MTSIGCPLEPRSSSSTSCQRIRGSCRLAVRETFRPNVTEIVICKFEFEPKTYFSKIVVCFLSDKCSQVPNPRQFLGKFSPQVANPCRFQVFSFFFFKSPLFSLFSHITKKEKTQPHPKEKEGNSTKQEKQNQQPHLKEEETKQHWKKEERKRNTTQIMRKPSSTTQQKRGRKKQLHPKERKRKTTPLNRRRKEEIEQHHQTKKEIVIPDATNFCFEFF